MKKYHVIGVMGTPQDKVVEVMSQVAKKHPIAKKPRFIEGGDVWLQKIKADPRKFYVVRETLPILIGLGIPVVDAHEVYNGYWVRIPIPEATVVKFLKGLIFIPRPLNSMVTRNLIKVAQRRES